VEHGVNDVNRESQQSIMEWDSNQDGVSIRKEKEYGSSP